MALPTWTKLQSTAKIPGVVKALYDAVKTELAAIRAGIPEDDSITRAKLKDAIIDYSAFDQNTKRFMLELLVPADDAADDVWTRDVYVPAGVKVITAGIVPQTQFGQATNYAVLKLINKGTDGLGTTEMASLNVNSSNVAAAHDFKSLGTITDPTVDAGSVLAFDKTAAGDGQVVPASTLVLVLERAA